MPIASLRRLERNGTFFGYTPLILGQNVDLIHSFNHIPINRNFVVSAELEMPRYLGSPSRWQIDFGMRQLAAERCRGIWTLSEASRHRLTRTFARAGFDELDRKLQVFRGAVLPGPPRRQLAGESTVLRLLFVGGDGLRKGLHPLIHAASQLRKNGVDLQLSVVGDVAQETYIVPGMIESTSEFATQLREQHWIDHYPTASNAKVRELMASHDVFVMPTMDDSLGWVVAEAAMSGMPCIVTNVFAMPELVADGSTGWIIDLPLNEDRRWYRIGDPTAVDAWQDAMRTITVGLTTKIGALAADRAAIVDAGIRARRHIETLYGLETASAQLNGMYEDAITNR